MDPRLSLITLAVSDLAAARRFYIDGLGWPVVNEVDGEVIFISVGQALVLSLWSRRTFESEVGDAAEPGRSPVVMAHNVQNSDEVDAVVAQVVEAGGRVLFAPQQREWGGYSAYVADPEGYRWEVAFNPTPMGEALLAPLDRPDEVPSESAALVGPRSRRRAESDEEYVIQLCEEVLGEPASRQHRFDWLLGDPGASGRRVRLPVDAYWQSLQLVVEYRELQHDQPTPFFDKPDRMTVSGVSRGEQRAIYDERRETELPAHGITLRVIRPRDLDAEKRGRLRRNREFDRVAIERILRSTRD